MQEGRAKRLEEYGETICPTKAATAYEIEGQVNDGSENEGEKKWPGPGPKAGVPAGDNPRGIHEGHGRSRVQGRKRETTRGREKSATDGTKGLGGESRQDAGEIKRLPVASNSNEGTGDRAMGESPYPA